MEGVVTNLESGGGLLFAFREMYATVPAKGKLK